MNVIPPKKRVILSIRRGAAITYDALCAAQRQCNASFLPSLRIWYVLYLLLMAVGLFFIHDYLNSEAIQLHTMVTPAYENNEIKPSFYLIYFIAIVFTITGFLALNWVHDLCAWMKKPIFFQPGILLILSISALFLMHRHLSGILTVIALLLSLSCLMNKNIRQQESLSFLIIPIPGIWLKFLLILPILPMAMILVQAWYPIIVPNDYYELQDNIRTSSMFASASHLPPTLTRNEAISCIEQSERATSVGPYPKLSDGNDHEVNCPLASHYIVNPTAKEILNKTGAWEVQAGRLLYHHSYIFVPARHMAHYGITADVPLLYGIGNTAMFAIIMKWFGDTLGDYFNYYFVSIFIGIIFISLFVYFTTRSWMAFLAAMALAMACFSGIDFTAGFMSAGFTPMRYLGLLLQVGSILLAFHLNKKRGVIALWVALMASMLWNREFAIVGFIGQALALWSPRLELKMTTRILSFIVLFSLLFGLLTLISLANPNLLFSNQFGFFGLGVPNIDAHQFFHLLLCLLPVVAVAAYGALRFPPAACHARLCILPVLVLLMIKYIFNVSPVHLFYALIFSAPLLLIYFPSWNKTIAESGRFECYMRIQGKMIIYLGSIIYLFYNGIQYQSQVETFRQILIRPFVVNDWSDLHDTLLSTAPGEPIARRVDAINQVLTPADTVLLLSPFDHLLSFYTLPRNVCGHFELLTNIVTTDQTEQVINCALHAPNVLVIYDKALENPKCSYSDAQKGYSDFNSCVSKWLLKQTLVYIRNQLSSDLQVVKETDDLILYRIHPESHVLDP